MKFIGFTDLKNKTTALCSLAYITSPGYTNIDSSNVHYHDCHDHDLDIYPQNARVMNPPPLNLTEFNYRLQFPEWKDDLKKTGSIFPADLRSTFSNITTPFNEFSPKFIEFNVSTTFNGIRTTYDRVPYLLQNKDSLPRCDETTPLYHL